MADARGVHTLSADGEAERTWNAPRFTELLRFEAADLDGDGLSEWVVLLDSGRFRSHVVRWDGTQWQMSKPWPGFLRPLVGPGGALRLAGQKSSAARPFQGPVVEVLLGEEGALDPGDPLSAPPDTPLYDFFWVSGESDRLFVLEEDGSITERDPRSPSAALWRSEERVVARPIEVEREVRGLLGDDREQKIRLAPRVSLTQLDEDAEPEVLIVTGPPVPTIAFENLRIFSGGDVRAYDVARRGLEELHRSPLLGRAMAAAQPWRLGDADVWVAAVWTRLAGGFSRPESRVFVLDPKTGNILEPSRSDPDEESE